MVERLYPLLCSVNPMGTPIVVPRVTCTTPSWDTADAPGNGSSHPIVSPLRSIHRDTGKTLVNAQRTMAELDQQTILK